MMKKENESLHKEYVELKNSIELLLKRRRILRNSLPWTIGVAILVSVILVKGLDFVDAIGILVSIVIISLIGLGILNFLIFGKLKKITYLIDKEAQQWMAKEEVLKTHFSISQKVHDEKPLVSEISNAFLLFLCSIFILPFIKGALVGLSTIIGIPFTVVIIGYMVIKHKKEKNFDNLYARYLSLIEKKLFN